jgi:site-specific DNA recombinase
MPAPRRTLAPVPDAPRRAVGLIRVSHVGDRVELMSPELQRTAIEDHASRRGMRITEWVEALEESGSQRRSPWWRRLDQIIARVEAGEFDAVLVWKVSRLARHRLKWAVAIDRIETAGGVLESATEALDTTTSAGRLGRGMLAEFAAFEAEQRGDVWREVHANRHARGLPHAGYARLGYIYEDKRYRPDPQTAPLVVDAYRRFLAGAGFGALTVWLAEQQLLSARTGRPWSQRGIRMAMDSGWAAGMLHFGGFTDPETRRWVEHRWEPAAHAPIIDAAMWDRYQRERRRRGDGREHKIYPPATPFAGMVRCTSCRGAMRAKRQGGATEMFQCENRGCERRCSVAIHRVAAAVLDWVGPLATDVEVRTAAQIADRAKRVRVRADAKVLIRQLEVNEDKQRNTARMLNEGVFDTAQFVSENARLKEEAERLQREVDRLAFERERPRPSRAAFRSVLEEWDSLGIEGLRAVLQGWGVRVDVVRQAMPGRRVSAGIVVTGGWERQGSG